MEGFYFIYVTGTQFGSNYFQLQWMFSLFNSNRDPNPNNPNLSQMNFYTPRYINITAGEPFTFVVAAYGNVAAQLVLIQKVTLGGLLSLEID